MPFFIKCRTKLTTNWINVVCQQNWALAYGWFYATVKQPQLSIGAFINFQLTYCCVCDCVRYAQEGGYNLRSFDDKTICLLHLIPGMKVCRQNGPSVLTRTWIWLQGQRTYFFTSISSLLYRQGRLISVFNLIQIYLLRESKLHRESFTNSVNEFYANIFWKPEFHTCSSYLMKAFFGLLTLIYLKRFLQLIS